MGFFSNLFFGKKDVEEKDYLKLAADYESREMYPEAIGEYEKLIADIYEGKESYKYRHITKKIVELNIKLGNYEKVIELWKKQFLPEEYGAKQKFALAVILEKAGKINETMKIYDENPSLQKQKIEFLIRLKRIDEANRECTKLLMSYKSHDKGIEDLWMLKGRILMSIRRWEEAESYFIKVLEKQSSNLEAKKLKVFCAKQARR
ncbi:MAG: hypothetical protein QXO70_03315 [Candidatus Pacearchaeota archaeon]